MRLHRTIRSVLAALGVTAGTSLIPLPARADGWTLLVASGENDRVLRYDQSGAVIDVFVLAGNGGLDTPTYVERGPDDNLYVCSQDTNEVLRYDGRTGDFIDVFASGNGLLQPQDLVFSTDGYLYVSSLGSHAVLRFDGQTGAFIDTFVARFSGGLSGPTGLAFGPDGNLYVSSWFTDQVLRYDAQTGAFIDSFARVVGSTPTNDDCVNAESLSHPGGDPANGIVVQFDVRCATDDTPSDVSACPRVPPPPIGHAIWYNYTAPCTGNLLISMCQGDGGAGNYDGILGVYSNVTGTCVCPTDNSLNVACNDDACGGGACRVWKCRSRLGVATRCAWAALAPVREQARWLRPCRVAGLAAMTGNRMSR